ncbi:MAG: DUF58 domain-containing protein [Ruminococcus sp.]|nr:DUF58 domain-containing protein [Ruminococcus sp.]
MFIIRLFYIILIIAAIVFYIMYLWDFAIVLLIVLLAIPVFLLVSLWITKKNLKVSMSVNSKTIQKNQSFPVQIKIDNSSFFPVGKAEALIEYCNTFNNENVNFVLHMPIQARNEQSAVFQLNSKFCGIIKIRCAGIKIFDSLRLFSFTVGKNIELSVTVMPESHEISGIVVYSDKANDESNIYSEYKPGDDPSQIFDLRSYNPGDKLNRIHWKLSSKKDEFIVKDYSLPIDVPCLIFVDLNTDCANNLQLPMFDTIIETLISLSTFLIENEKNHSIVFYNCQKKCFSEFTVTDADSIAVVVKNLIFSLNNDTSLTYLDYFSENSDLSLSSFVYISGSVKSDLISFIDDEIDADFKNILVTVSAEEDCLNLMDSNSNVVITPVLIGKISSSITDIEV